MWMGKLSGIKPTRLSVQSGGKLVDGSWHLETLQQDGLLSLQANILWPFDESGQIAFRLNVLTYLYSSKNYFFNFKTIKVAFPLRPGSVICLSINCFMRKVTNNCWFGVIIAIGVLVECMWNNKKMYKPMPKFLGLFSNSGLTTFLDSTTFDLSGAAATLLLPFLAPLTGFLTPGLAGCKWQET